MTGLFIKKIKIDTVRADISSYTEVPHVFFLINIEVPKEDRGKGLGKSMLHSCEAICKQFGASFIRILVGKTSWIRDWVVREGYRDMCMDLEPDYIWLEKKIDQKLAIVECSRITECYLNFLSIYTHSYSGYLTAQHYKNIFYNKVVELKI